MSLSLVSFLLLLGVLLGVEEVRQQRFTRLQIPLYISLFFSFLFLVISNKINLHSKPILCPLFGLLIQFFILSAFSWLTAISTDIWLTFRRIQNPIHQVGYRGLTNTA